MSKTGVLEKIAREAYVICGEAEEYDGMLTIERESLSRLRDEIRKLDEFPKPEGSAMNERQLRLEREELEELGFVENISHVPGEYNDGTVRHEVRFKIKTINGFFSYNPNPSPEHYEWFHVTVIGGKSNHVNLNISNFADLQTLLKAFKS